MVCFSLLASIYSEGKRDVHQHQSSRKAIKLLELVTRCVRRFDPRWSFIRGLPERGRILEIGCGGGENCLVLQAARPDWEIYGLDVLPASQVPEFVRYARHNLEDMPLPYSDAHFDAVLFVHVIEHLRHPADLNSEITRLLRPGGRFYVETPNYTSLFVPSFGLKRNQHHPFNFFDDLGHVRPYSKQALSSSLKTAGCKSKQSATRATGCACQWIWLVCHWDFSGATAGRQ